METGLPTGSIMKYNFFVNPFPSCKTHIIICNNTGRTYTMQELVKEVTLINHSNNGFANLHGINQAFSLGSILNYNFLINPFSSDTHTYVSVLHYNAGDSYEINTH